MASSAVSDFLKLPHLSPEQQSLLLAALSSNSQKNKKQSLSGSNGKNNASTVSPAMNSTSYSSLTQDTFTSPINSGAITFGDTLFPDYNESNTNFDVDFPAREDELLGEFANFGNDESEAGEKRKSPDDEDEDEEEGDSKRREGDDKVAKKPGRKLITAEPTTKRKAQNRAAQRAFRERKEKHVKDLEQKVNELEKTTDTTSQENGVLRAQIDRLQSELQEYKKRLSLNGSGLGGSPPTRGLGASYTPSGTYNGVMSDFQFNFAKFGEGSSFNLAGTGRAPALRSEHSQSSNNSNRASQSPGNKQTSSSSVSANSVDGQGQSGNKMTANGFSWLMPGNLDLDSGNFGDFSNNIDYGLTSFQSPVDMGNGVTSGNSNTQNTQRHQSRSTSCTSNAQSPAASSIVHTGPTSSCGTSPEPLPNYASDQLKNGSSDQQDLSGIREGQLTSIQNASPYDFSNLDWLSHQNGGQFDPVLFGDYRESQDAVVGDGDFTSGFFGDSYNFGDLTNESYDFGMNTPNQPLLSTTVQPAATVSAPTKEKSACASLMERVERCRNGEDDNDSSRSNNELITANKLWTELRTCPKFLAGEFDIDTLCTELSSKATCSETGLAVPKDIVEKVLWQLAGVPDGGDWAVAEKVKESQREAMRSSAESRKNSGL